MEKKKPRGSRTTTDELALVKAAAWAWYERGSGSEGKPMMAEFDIPRTPRVFYRPSRYRLEAMRVSQEEEDQEAEDQSSQISTSSVHSNNNIDNNSLLDTYEIQSISKRLDQLINSSTCNELLSHGGDHYDGGDDRKKKVSQNSDQSNNGLMKLKKKWAKKSKGFWLMRHAVTCGKREDVVAADETLSRVRERPPEKRPALVKLATCRPRVLNHA